MRYKQTPEVQASPTTDDGTRLRSDCATVEHAVRRGTDDRAGEVPLLVDGEVVSRNSSTCTGGAVLFWTGAMLRNTAARQCPGRLRVGDGRRQPNKNGFRTCCAGNWARNARNWAVELGITGNWAWNPASKRPRQSEAAWITWKSVNIRYADQAEDYRPWSCGLTRPGSG